MNAIAAQTSTSLAPGSWLDRYELLARIAEGGFGQVWLARLQGKRGFEKLVAIKVPRLNGDVAFQEMLLDEARIASAIDHENVVRIIELGEQGEILYIVMEWIDGEPLSSLLRTLERKKVDFPLTIALRVVAETCAAAHAAHELLGPDGTPLGVVHRDISPQNILISATGRAKLIDFGIVKAKDRATGETTDGTLKGKIKYMAPEQAFGNAIDRRTDVFALGAVLYRLLIGRAPYERDNEVATLHQLNAGAPVFFPNHIPPIVRAILEKALDRSPATRFATAREMEHALVAATASLNLTADAATVATFVEEHLHERMTTRRQAVEVALKAAADRSAIQKVAVSFTQPSSSQRLDAIYPSSMGSDASIDYRPVPAPTPGPKLWLWAMSAFGITLIAGTVLIVLAVRSRAATRAKVLAAETTATSLAVASPSAPLPASPLVAPSVSAVALEAPTTSSKPTGSANAPADAPASTARTASPRVDPKLANHRSGTPKVKPPASGSPGAPPTPTTDFGY